MKTYLTLAAAGAALILQAGAAPAEDSAAAAYADIEADARTGAGHVQGLPQVGHRRRLGGVQDVQLNPDTALDGKTKELVGLAVAAQIPCAYCIYFHTNAAKANGASEQEVQEAVAMAAIVRHWRTVLNGMQVDLAIFRAETDDVLARAGKAPPRRIEAIAHWRTC